MLLFLLFFSYKPEQYTTEKPHDAVVLVKFDTYRNLHWHRAVLLAIALLLLVSPNDNVSVLKSGL